MTSTNSFSNMQTHIPLVGDATLKSPIAYKTTRLLASAFNATQMAMAEAYINGLEIPNSVFRSLLHTSMPILFKHFPSLLAPYDWVLQESDQLAESSRELMKVQYDLPQTMLNSMLGDRRSIPTNSDRLPKKSINQRSPTQHHKQRSPPQKINQTAIAYPTSQPAIASQKSINQRSPPQKINQPAIASQKINQPAISISSF